MFSTYCRLASARVKGCEPKHPLYVRNYETAPDKFVEAQSFDDTPIDAVSDTDAPTFAEQIKAGEIPEKLKSAVSVNGLGEAEFARQFVSLFRAAGAVAPAPAPADAVAAAAVSAAEITTE